MNHPFLLFFTLYNIIWHQDQFMKKSEKSLKKIYREYKEHDKTFSAWEQCGREGMKTYSCAQKMRKII